jgi:hypothetical protein
MKRREQAQLLLRKAAQDEALLDEVLTSDHWCPVKYFAISDKPLAIMRIVANPVKNDLN